MSSGFLRGPLRTGCCESENERESRDAGRACARVRQSLAATRRSLALGTGAGLGLLIDGQAVFRGGEVGSAGENRGTCQFGHDPTFADPICHAAHSSSRWGLTRHSWIVYRRQGGTAAATVTGHFQGSSSKETKWRRRSSTATARLGGLAVVTLQSLLDLELIGVGGSIGVPSRGLYERVPTGPFRPSSHDPIAIAPSRPWRSARGLIGAAWAAGADPASEP